ncbi:hypothetical protein Scep_021874 [Stephania cephalantha]|uniref:Uncharacterized protein n=1 Tax=Stephania cephalantha TaxID=152367 RepID=A0AAP0I1T3_9MAGN
MRHHAVHSVAATPSLVGRRRRRSPAAATAGEFLRVASHRRWFVAADPTRCRAVTAGVTAVTMLALLPVLPALLPVLPAASLCLAGATARWSLLTPARPFALPIGRVTAAPLHRCTAAPLHCWPAAASRRRSCRRAGESPDLLCRRAGVTESPTTERHRAAVAAVRAAVDVAAVSRSSIAGVPLSLSLLPITLWRLLLPLFLLSLSPLPNADLRHNSSIFYQSMPSRAMLYKHAKFWPVEYQDSDDVV